MYREGAHGFGGACGWGGARVQALNAPDSGLELLLSSVQSLHRISTPRTTSVHRMIDRAHNRCIGMRASSRCSQQECIKASPYHHRELNRGSNDSTSLGHKEKILNIVQRQSIPRSLSMWGEGGGRTTVTYWVQSVYPICQASFNRLSIRQHELHIWHI